MEYKDDLTWSIRLGFDGELSNNFYKKRDSVFVVRHKIIKDLIISAFTLSMFTVLYIIITNLLEKQEVYGYLTIFLWIFIIISFFSTILHARVVIQWLSSDNRHINEYAKKHNIK